MSRPLPEDREKALEAIANGWGRVATAAHPLCRCGKPYLPACPSCSAKVGKPCREEWGFSLPESGRHFTRVERVGSARECPVHRPARGSS